MMMFKTKRRAGDATGAVMLEYVILAVLIVAACVVAVVLYGKALVGMVDVAPAGDHDTAKSVLDTTTDSPSGDKAPTENTHDSTRP